MKTWVTDEYYGGDSEIIAQAAQSNGAQLVAINGYTREDYPYEPSYIEGKAQYLFLVERPLDPKGVAHTHRIAQNTVYIDIRASVRTLTHEWAAMRPKLCTIEGEEEGGGEEGEGGEEATDEAGRMALFRREGRVVPFSFS